jgi:hypothetical protein
MVSTFIKGSINSITTFSYNQLLACWLPEYEDTMASRPDSSYVLPGSDTGHVLTRQHLQNDVTIITDTNISLSN